jgi:sarcosine oxidase gamma subunit
MIAAAEALQEDHLVDISVNNRPVRIEGPKATGLQIKEAAIAQGVPIQLSFQVSEQLGDHKTKIIGDTDPVTLHEGAKFVAIANDDNS